MKVWPFISPFEAYRRGGERGVLLLAFAHAAMLFLIAVPLILAAQAGVTRMGGDRQGSVAEGTSTRSRSDAPSPSSNPSPELKP